MLSMAERAGHGMGAAELMRLLSLWARMHSILTNGILSVEGYAVLECTFVRL